MKTDFRIVCVCGCRMCLCAFKCGCYVEGAVVLRDDKMAAEKDTKIGENGRYRRRRRIINLATSRIS